MRQERFTDQAQEALVVSQELVRHHRRSQWDVEHILLALLEQWDGLAIRILEELEIQVVDLLVKELEKRLDERQVSLELTEEARLWLVNEGYDPIYGARPLRRAIQRYVENPLSKRILLREFEEGDGVVVGVEEGKGLVFRKSDSLTKAGAS